MDMDQSATRRNLMVTSIGFVLYSFGKGTVESKLSLPIGFTLESPEVLIYAAWIALFWFFYRYRLFSRSVWSKTLSEFFRCMRSAKYKNEIIEKSPELLSTINHQAGVEDYIAQAISAGPKKGFYSWTLSLSGVRTQKNHDVRIPIPDTGVEIDLPFRKAYVIKTKAILNFLYNRNEFSNLVIPYMMFFLAVFVGIAKWIQPEMNPFEFLMWIGGLVWWVITHL